MNTLTTPQHDYLASGWQRHRLLVAVFPAFKLLTTTKMRDATKEFDIPQGEWNPVLNIGPNRIGFIGESLTFDAIDSFRYTFDGKKERTKVRSQGYGKGALDLLTWEIRGLSPTQTWRNKPWDQPISWTPTQGGLHSLECWMQGQEDFVARRWIRVYANREGTDWEVIGVDGITGGWGGGWQAQLRLAATHNTSYNVGYHGASTGVEDCAGIGIYCEDSWYDGSSFVTHTMGSTRQEPRCLFMGYVKEGTIQRDVNGRQVQLQLESITGQMDRSMHHKIAIWDNKGPDVDKPDNDEVGGDTREKRRAARRKARRKANQDTNKDDRWGTVLKGFKDTCVADFALYLLQFKTNLLQYHDFYTTWNEDQAALESIAGEETSVLSNLETVGGNDWFVTGAMADNSLYFAPDRQVVRDTTWENKWPVRMTLTDDLMLTMELTRIHEQPVKYVKLTATKVADFESDSDRRKRARKQEKRNQIEVAWPDDGGKEKVPEPSTTTPGNWYVRSDLLHDDKAVVKRRAEKLYLYLNTRWAAAVKTALNHAIYPGAIVELAPSNAVTLWGVSKKIFLCMNVSYEIDLEKAQFVAQYEFEEYVGG